jgi:hypothetical protein
MLNRKKGFHLAAIDLTSKVEAQVRGSLDGKNYWEEILTLILHNIRI